MKKRVDKKTLKIASATSMSIFSLAAVFVATYAWFAMNTNVDGSGMNVTISDIRGRLEHAYFYAYDDDDAEDKIFKFSKTAFATYDYDWNSKSVDIKTAGTASDWNLGYRTALDHDHPILVIFEFDDDYVSASAGDIYIRGNTTVNGFLGERKANGDPVYELPLTEIHDAEHPRRLLLESSGGTDYYAFSSVVDFRALAFSEDEYRTFLSSCTDDTLDFPLNTLTHDQTFANVNNVSEQVTFEQHPYLFRSTANSTIRYIAMTVEYSFDAIGYIYTTYLGDPGLESYDNDLHFKCDWSLEVC